MQIYENDILVKDYIPVFDTTNNVYGIYDTSANAFLGNAGTGAFTGGTEYLDTVMPVEYLKSDGNAYIDMGIYPNVDRVYDFEMNVDGATLQSAGIFGCVDGSSSSRKGIRGYYNEDSNALRLQAGGSVDMFVASPVKDTWHKITIEATDGSPLSVTVDGVRTVGTVNTDLNYTQTMLLFNQRIGSGVYANRAIVAFKRFKAGADRDYIPIRIGDTGYMFDLVEWKLYGNAGTGAFAYGSDIPYAFICPDIITTNRGDIDYRTVLVPSEYEVVEYIESHGTEYIGTDVKITSDDEVYLDGCTTTSGSIFLLSQGLSANNQAYQLANTAANGLVFDIQSYDPYRVKTNVSVLNTIRKIHIKNREIFVDEVSKGTSTGTLANPTETAKLFYSISGTSAQQAKIAKFTVVGKCDLVPVKKKSNNEYGFYDLVTKAFFGNAGTGAFTGGQPVLGTHKVFISEQGVVDLGTLTWRYDGGWFKTSLPIAPNEPDTLDDLPNAYCDKLLVSSYRSLASAAYGITIVWKTSGAHGEVWAKDNRFTTGAEFKSAMGGKHLFYQRTTDEEFIQPIVVNITSILPSATSYENVQTGQVYIDWRFRVLDGTESWSISGERFQGAIAGGSYACKVITGGICTHYQPYGSASNPYTFSWSTSGNSIFIRHPAISTVAEFKAWLAEQYAKGEPVIVLYPLETPATETIIVTPVSLTSKAEYTIVAEAQLPVTEQAVYLGLGG